MGSWWSIEVIDGTTSGRLWRDLYGDALVEHALAERAIDWCWGSHTWGVVFEVAFADEAAWERFLARPGVRAVLDAVPDPLYGLLLYRGRGGSSGAPEPRRTRPLTGAGAVASPLPMVDDDLALGLPHLPKVLSLR